MSQIKQHIISCILAVSSITTSFAVLAESSAQKWQMSRLMQPSQGDLQREQQGHIMIYHGMTDKVVLSALDNNFDRIQSMMFTGTIITNDAGEAAVDPDTGEAITEYDGCD
jgi:hypothetical protein